MRRFGRAHGVLQLAANWERRVMEVVESFPCRLLFLAKYRPEMDSSGGMDRCRQDCRWELRRELCCWEAQGSLRARDRAREVHWRALPYAFPADL